MLEKQRYELKQWHVIAIGAIMLSVLVFTVCLGILIGLPTLIEKNIRDGSMLIDGSPLLPKWSNPQYAIKSRIWTYSVTNPDAVVNGSKPSLTKKGPYVFDQTHRREIASNTNGTLKYELFKRYNFNDGASCSECSLRDRVWAPNLVFQKFVDAASKPATAAATAALVVQTPFLEVEVAELLFAGYVDPFLDQVCAIPFVGFICESILDLPERIGFFYGKNNSSPGIFEINNGEQDRGESLGKIISFNGEASTPETWWNDEQARAINGTEASLFQPFISKTRALEVFAPDLCRSVRLVFDREVRYGRLNAYRFVIAKDNFNYSLPQNAGFCNDNGKRFYEEQAETNCLPHGLLDISRCTRGEPPVVISMPNFAFAPDYVLNSVEGLQSPNAERDLVQVDIEPRLGVILAAKRRFQINVAMWRGENLALPGLDLSRFYNSIVPVISIEETADIDQDSLSIIKTNLVDMEAAVQIASLSGVISSLIAGIMVVLYIGHRTGRIRKVVRKATVRVRDAAHSRSVKDNKSTSIVTPPTSQSSQSQI